MRCDVTQVRRDVIQVRHGVVRHHDGRVEGQDEDHPVPDGLVVVQLASNATEPQQSDHFQGTEQAANALFMHRSHANQPSEAARRSHINHFRNRHPSECS